MFTFTSKSSPAQLKTSSPPTVDASRVDGMPAGDKSVRASTSSSLAEGDVDQRQSLTVFNSLAAVY